MSEQELRECMQTFIRSLGLLDQGCTLCGQPIPASQAHALQILGRVEGLTQQALAGQLGLEKSTISRLVAQLVEQDWVTKSVNPESRREVQLSLTDRGHTMLARVNRAAAVKFHSLWEHVPPEKRDQVLESLTILTTALREK